MRGPPLVRLLGIHLRGGHRPVAWPEEDLEVEGGPRGPPGIDAGACTGCGECASACPSGCLRLGEEGPPVVDAGQCVRCGICAEVCPEGAVRPTHPGAMAAHRRQDLVLDGEMPAAMAVGPPPRWLYRRAIAGPARRIWPAGLLAERLASLGQRDDGEAGGGDGD